MFIIIAHLCAAAHIDFYTVYNIWNLCKIVHQITPYGRTADRYRGDVNQIVYLLQGQIN